MVVSFAELDLSKPAGASALYDRLQRAAAEVCGLNSRMVGVSSATSISEQMACYRDALSRAVSQVDSPLVSEQHAG